MHEMSIAQSILEVVQQYTKGNDQAKDANAPRVKSVHLKIGEMAGVVPESLRFCFEVASEGTAVQGAELLIDEVPITCRCVSCNAEFSVERFLFLCPTCGTPDVELISGNELDVVELDLLEEADTAKEPSCR
jgi:hydrogenase nickel incorporation protein HypA/HybF